MKKKSKKSPLGWKKEKGKDNFTYYFKESVAKRFKIKKIEFIGFDAQPIGLFLYKTGGGFNRNQSNKVGGDFVLTFLSAKYKREIKLSIFANGHGTRNLKILKNSVSISLPFDNFFKLLENLGDEIKENKNNIIEKRLSVIFPKEFKNNFSDGGTTDSKLNDVSLENLEENDHESIGKFIKKYISLNSDNNEVLKNLQTDLVISGRKKSLDSVIKKFEKHLINKKFDEKKWQKFLHEEVFFFNSNYIESIREANVNIGKVEERERKPDFVWIDIYGFLDVFEIKTPFTDILSKGKDTSHDNYFFSREASKAISQIEKYILYLERNVEGFEKYLTKKTKNPFSVLKPKAFLIIGRSREINSNPSKKNDFRLLRRSFKNLELMTFDELLDNLKSLSSKFEKDTK